MYNGQERRKYQRVKKPVMVKFRMNPKHPDTQPSSTWDMVAVLDIGAGGLLFYYNKPVEVGTILDIKIDLADGSSDTTYFGKVIRAEKVIVPHMFLVAVNFSDLDAKARDKIAHALEKYTAGK
ncbi:MAG: PilZ domain-containing protein [Candidatus Omnitrophica bacterium]|nr:PilZ domain-containing protein [Candidatus Omnitrophota bacterium]